MTTNKEYNEYLTKEQNDSIDRETFLSAKQILDLDEKDTEAQEANETQEDKEIAELLQEETI